MAARADIMAGRAYVSLYVKQDALTRGLNKVRADVNKFGADIIGIGAKVMAIGGAVAAPIAFATKAFAEFDDMMREVKAVSQSTEAQFRSMTEVAKELGRTTSFTAVQVAGLMAELGRAGFKPEQINVMTAAVMNLARASKTEAVLASGIMAATIRQFGLEAGDAARVSDVLTHAANATFNSVENLGEALSYAGPVARELGMSLEDTVAVLGSLGNVGIQGSEAGTALRRLGVISAATGTNLKAIFDISNIDAAGNLKPIVQIMDEIGKKIASLPMAEKVAKMNEAFGLLGITSASVLSRAAGDTQKLANELKNAEGVAKRTAAEMDAGLGGAFRIILSAAEGLQLAIGKALSGSIQSITNAITGLLGSAAKWVSLNEEMAVMLAVLTIGAIASGSALVGIGIAAKVAAIGIGVLVSGVGAIKTVFSVALGAAKLFRAAAVGVATVMQTLFSASVASSVAAVSAMTVVQTAATAGLIPYTVATVSAANATALLAITTATAATSMIPYIGSVASAVGSNAGLILSTGGASAGLMTMAGSAGIAATSTGVASAAAGVLATAWTAASGAIAAAWGVILGPMTPFLIAGAAVVAIIAGIAAKAAYATAVAMDFSKAWGIASETLSALFSIAKRVGGILMEALAGGDYDIAMKAAMAGVKLAMATTIESMSEMWELFWAGAWESAKTFMRNLASMSASVMKAVAKAIASPGSGGAALYQTIAEITEGIPVSFKIDTKGMASDASKELDKLEAELAGRKEKRDADAKAKAEREAKEATGARGSAGPTGDGAASGDMTQEQLEGAAAAEAAKTAFDRETESIQQQIIALREGADAAERFRLKQQGLSDAEVDKVMAMKAQQEALEKQKSDEEANSQRIVGRIQDYADADYERGQKNKQADVTPAEIAKREKAAIEMNRQAGRITEESAKEAMAQADLRQADREHKAKLKAFSGDDKDAVDAADGTAPETEKRASAATFSARSLMAMAVGSGESPQVKAIQATKKAIQDQTARQIEDAERNRAEMARLGMHHP